MGSSSLISSNSVGRSLFALSIIFNIILSWISTPVLAANVTVDDSDPGFYYSDGWREGETCGNVCQIKPDDLTRVERQTWKDATADGVSISFNYTFQGTDIYIYGIVYNSLRVTSNVNLSLYLDDAKVDAYTHPARNDSTFEYRVPVFAEHNLADTTHKIMVLLEHNSHFIFDYLVYNAGATSSSSSATTSSTGTFPTGSPSNSSKGISTGAIIGIVIGSLLFLLLVAGLFLYYTRRHKKRLESVPKPGQMGQLGAKPYMVGSTPNGPAPSGPTPFTFLPGGPQQQQQPQQTVFRNQPSVPNASGYLPVPTSNSISPFPPHHLQPAVTMVNNPPPMKYANYSNYSQQSYPFQASGPFSPDDSGRSLVNTGSDWNDGSSRAMTDLSSAQWVYPNVGGGPSRTTGTLSYLGGSEVSETPIQPQVLTTPAQLRQHPQPLTANNMAQLYSRTNEQERRRIDAVSLISAPPPPYPESSFSPTRSAPPPLPSEYAQDHELETRKGP